MYPLHVPVFQDPPNFLRASDLSSHVTPVVVVPENPPEEVEPEPDVQDAATDFLIDTNVPVRLEYFLWHTKFNVTSNHDTLFSRSQSQWLLPSMELLLPLPSLMTGKTSLQCHPSLSCWTPHPIGYAYVCGRDLLIARLMSELNELKRELARTQAEGAAVAESLHNRLKELEMELEELRQIAEASTQVSCTKPMGIIHRWT